MMYRIKKLAAVLGICLLMTVGCGEQKPSPPPKFADGEVVVFKLNKNRKALILGRLWGDQYEVRYENDLGEQFCASFSEYELEKVEE